jgi:hypothetical protein
VTIPSDWKGGTGEDIAKKKDIAVYCTSQQYRLTASSISISSQPLHGSSLTSFSHIRPLIFRVVSNRLDRPGAGTPFHTLNVTPRPLPFTSLSLPTSVPRAICQERLIASDIPSTVWSIQPTINNHHERGLQRSTEAAYTGDLQISKSCSFLGMCAHCCDEVFHITETTK